MFLGMSSLTVFILCIVSLKTRALTDFQDNVPPYRFVYHDLHNLLLVHGDADCFYINSTSLPPGALELSSRDETEALLMRVLGTNETGRVQASSMEEVRDAFQDVLADYRCMQDNIFIVHSSPFTSPAAEKQLTLMQQLLGCQFEDGFCGWLQGAGDQLNWALHKGNTSLDGHTGPSSDHTIGTERGEYIFLNSSRGRAGDTAELVSQFLTIPTPVCLQFWYSMNGADVGRLDVSVQDPSGRQTVVWNMTGHQGTSWHKADVTIQPPRTRAQTQILFAATRGPSSSGDIAVDDVTLTEGDCWSAGSPTSGLHIVTTPQETLQTDLMCDFEDGFCGWLQSTEDGRNWQLQKGQAQNGIGPGSDHTLLTDAGEYVYVDNGQGDANTTADLVSPYLSLNRPVCIHLWRNANGHYDVTSLVILSKTPDGRYTELERVTGGPDKAWRAIAVTIWPRPTNGGQQQIVIRAIQGQATVNRAIQGQATVNSYLAIDDITVAVGACSPGS